jgi:predicted nucleotidyltransferase
MEAAEAIKEAVRAIRRHLPRRDAELFLFGSRAKSTHSEGSDIDIAILGSRRIAGPLLSRIKEDVRAIPTLRRIDIVDLNGSDARFKREVLSHAKTL